jgi:predicted transcriptional regulator YdeE
MKPEILSRSRLLLAGIMASGKEVSEVDIPGLWSAYEESEPGIPNRIDGSWYELHIGVELGCGIYSVIAGAEISEPAELPVEVSLKVVPAGKYAHFAHRMKDGDYHDAFAQVEKWVNESQIEILDFGLQHYDRDFDPDNKDSILHIYIPLG